MIALSLTGPAAAWDNHAISHLTSPVAADEHHHHADDGTVVRHMDEGSRSTDHAPDDDDGGHDHMPSLLAALSGLPPEGTPFLAYFPDGDRFAPLMANAPPDLPPSLQIRPPRSV